MYVGAGHGKVGTDKEGAILEGLPAARGGGNHRNRVGRLVGWGWWIKRVRDTLIQCVWGMDCEESNDKKGSAMQSRRDGPRFSIASFNPGSSVTALRPNSEWHPVAAEGVRVRCAKPEATIPLVQLLVHRRVAESRRSRQFCAGSMAGAQILDARLL